MATILSRPQRINSLRPDDAYTLQCVIIGSAVGPLPVQLELIVAWEILMKF